MGDEVKRIRLNCLTVAVGSPEEPLGRDLQRLKGRSRGARLRQLALLGLALESQGFRRGDDGEVRWPAVGRQPAPASAPSPAPPVPRAEGSKLDRLAPQHQIAMKDLVASLGGFEQAH